MLEEGTELTAEILRALPEGPFAEGIVENAPGGCHMTQNGGQLRYVATKGHADDWAVYVDWSHKPALLVRAHGNKLGSPENIRACVPCDDEALAMYRR